MALKQFKPNTPGQRFKTVNSFAEVTKSTPEKSLLQPLSKNGGRNNTGRITVRRQGGGHKRAYRIIDFKRDKVDVPANVDSIQYDPNRSAFIALLHYLDGEKRYILAPNGLKANDTVVAGEKVEINVGNCMPLVNIPLGTTVHNIELKAGKGGQMARGAGSYAQLMAKEGNYAQLKLPSGEVRMVRLECRATIGQVGNLDHENIKIGKAGRSRWLGKRPKVRGVAMNPVDHPMGAVKEKVQADVIPARRGASQPKATKRERKNRQMLLSLNAGINRIL